MNMNMNMNILTLYRKNQATVRPTKYAWYATVMATATKADRTPLTYSTDHHHLSSEDSSEVGG